MTERGRVIIKIGFVVASVSVLFFATASPSFAQVDDVTDSVSDAADSAGDAVDEAADRASDAVDDATDKANDTAGDATDAVDNATGGNATVDDATDKVDEAVDNVTDTADETADRGSDTVDETTDKVNELVGEDEGGRRHPLDKTLRNVSSVLGNVLDGALGRDESTSGAATRPRSGNRDGNGSSVRGRRFNQRNEAKPALDRALGSIAGSALISARSATGTASEEAASQTATQRILENVARVATTMAFPLALLALVAAFLIVQSRVDRNDPKLVLAPLDAEQEYLSFR